MTSRRRMLLMGMADPDLAAIAIGAGLDTVVADIEHGFPLDGVRGLVGACRQVGGELLVRLPPSEVDRIGSLADVGVDGFILSLVRSLDELEHGISLARFPPTGSRSLNPFVSAAGAPGDTDALLRSADALAIWSMAETSELLETLAATDRLPEACRSLRGIVIGPYDLSRNIGGTSGPENADLLAAVRRYGESADRLGIAWGLFVRDRGALRAWTEAGVEPETVVVGYDRDIWYSECLKRATY